MKIFSFIWKCFYLILQLYSKCICMPIIVSEFFQKNFKFYKLSYSQFYYRYFRGKSSILSNNFSTSFLDYILIVLVCLPFYLWTLPQKFSIFKFFLWISLTLSVMCYMKSSVLSENVSTSFQLWDTSICMPISISEFFPKKIFNFISYNM